MKQIIKKFIEKQNQKAKSRSGTKEIHAIVYIFVLMFIGMIGYLTYFNLFVSEEVISSSYNKRQDTFADRIVRGEILSANGEVLAQTLVDESGNETRYYPYGDVFAHVVGYTNNGKSGIESLFNYQLLTSNANLIEQIYKEIKEEKNIGDNIVTTLNTKLQQVAYDALGSSDGAIVVMEPDTGKILAMVSKPDFDPNTLSEDWDSIISDSSNSNLLNRATQGLYPPGSTFKILTALEYMRENEDYENYSYDCNGSIEVDGNRLPCYHGNVHGTQNLTSSFANSCNSSFANIGLNLNRTSFASLCSDFLFNKSLPFALQTAKSSFVLNDNSDTWETMLTSIGQGQTVMTPLHNALIVSAVANEGVIMKPYLVDHIENYVGDTIKRYYSSKYSTVMTKSEAAVLEDMMEAVVDEGTATMLNTSSYEVAGKTGSAETVSDGQDVTHAWFVGYSSTDGESDIVVSILVEDADSSSTSAVPIARAIFNAYYE